MGLKQTVPLLAVVVAATLLLPGCSGDKLNAPPVIGSIAASPDRVMRAGEKVTLTVSATDKDGDLLAFTWSASAGTLSATSGETVVWTAPDPAADAVISVICGDGHGGEDNANRSIAMRAWLYGDMDGATPESTYLRNPGTSEAVFYFEMDDLFPEGAIVESAFVTTDFEPIDELEYEVFNVWAVSPSGTTVLLYDGFNLTNLNVDDFSLNRFAGETAEGNWKIRVTRNAKGVEGYADECDMTVYYRY